MDLVFYYRPGQVIHFQIPYVLWKQWKSSPQVTPPKTPRNTGINVFRLFYYTPLLSSDTPVQDDIQFESTMPMFKDDGRDIYEFTAKYQDRFYSKNIQRGYSENNNLVIEVKPCCL